MLFPVFITPQCPFPQAIQSKKAQGKMCEAITQLLHSLGKVFAYTWPTFCTEIIIIFFYEGMFLLIGTSAIHGDRKLLG